MNDYKLAAICGVVALILCPVAIKGFITSPSVEVEDTSVVEEAPIMGVAESSSAVPIAGVYDVFVLGDRDRVDICLGSLAEENVDIVGSAAKQDAIDKSVEAITAEKKKLEEEAKAAEAKALEEKRIADAKALALAESKLGSKVPNYLSGCKSWNITYMSYTAVTSKRSNQWKLLRAKGAYTDPTSGIRMYDGYYCIALGTGYTSEIGTIVRLHMANGAIFDCVLGDVKANQHTDPTNCYQKWDGSVAEMIIDRSIFKSTKQYPSGMSGDIDRVEVLSKKVDIFN